MARKKPVEKRRPRCNTPKPSFLDVARKIAPTETPTWLPSLLDWWSAGLQTARAAEMQWPMRSDMKKSLAKIQAASDCLQKSLADARIRVFIEAEGRGFRLPDLYQLQRLSELSAAAANSKFLNGAGRARATKPDNLSARQYCAAQVITIWDFLYGAVPAPRNPTLDAATDAYWLASGGEQREKIESDNRWRPHFTHFNTVKDSPAVVALCKIWRRDLLQAKRAGRSPWRVPELI
ncbi:hypothetical protein [Pseudorhodoplanes sp.]|uniref:hypothetical protein n=1 Tax=Pseudorhodoplanes sp. TaxID=1934341 RepID=UPI003D150B3E